MATKHNCSCFEKAADDEPIFVVRAQDKNAPFFVRYWALIAENTGSPKEKVEEARKLADEMEEWAKTHQTKIPD